MKKITCIFVVSILLIFSLTGCGSKPKTPEVAAVQAEVKAVENQVNEIAKEAGSDIKVNLGQMGTNLKLPDNFPKDVAPVMDGANIVNIIDNKEGKSMGIIYSIDKSTDEMRTFYEEALKDAEDFNQFAQDAVTMISGKKDGYRVSTTIVKDEKTNATSVMLDVNYSEIAEKEAKLNLFASTDAVAFPEKYPIDLLPLLDGDKLIDGSYSESNGATSYYLRVLSNKSLKDLVDGYTASWIKATDVYKSMDSSSFDFQGTVDKFTFNMMGNYDEESKTVEYTLEINQ